MAGMMKTRVNGQAIREELGEKARPGRVLQSTGRSQNETGGLGSFEQRNGVILLAF